MATGAIAAFTTVQGSPFMEVLAITLAFLLMAFPCVGIWLVFGSLLRKVLTNPLMQRLFNITMALILVLSVVPVMIELWHFYMAPAV